MEIPLTQGKVAHIDDADWPLVAPYTWFAVRKDGLWYAHATPFDSNRKSAKLKMHQVILGSKWVDHRDGNGLNNRRSNLRRCTNAQNQQNTGSRQGASRYKGVSWSSQKGRWKVAFRFNGEQHFVGHFRDEIEAARAYDDAILPLAGEFARLNFPIAA